MNSKVIEDLARLASGAVGTVAGLRDEAGQQVRERFDRVLARSDLVSREEFEVVREMVAAARAQQEVLAERLDALDAKLAAGTSGAPARHARQRRSTIRAAGRARTAKKPGSK